MNKVPHHIPPNIQATLKIPGFSDWVIAHMELAREEVHSTNETPKIVVAPNPLEKRELTAIDQMLIDELEEAGIIDAAQVSPDDLHPTCGHYIHATFLALASHERDNGAQITKSSLPIAFLDNLLNPQNIQKHFETCREQAAKKEKNPEAGPDINESVANPLLGNIKFQQWVREEVNRHIEAIEGLTGTPVFQSPSPSIMDEIQNQLKDLNIIGVAQEHIKIDDDQDAALNEVSIAHLVATLNWLAEFGNEYGNQENLTHLFLSALLDTPAIEYTFRNIAGSTKLGNQTPGLSVSNIEFAEASLRCTFPLPDEKYIQ